MTESIDLHVALQGVQAEANVSASTSLRQVKSTQEMVNSKLTQVPFLMKNGLFIRALKFIPVSRAASPSSSAQAAGVPTISPAATPSEPAA